MCASAYSPGADLGGRVQGVLTPPPPSPLPRCPAAYADMFDMYSQQFTLCYCQVKSLLLRIHF